MHAIIPSILAGITLVLPLWVSAAQANDCAGTPSQAVTTLPEPLNQWGSLVCTQYGHVIAAREGWIWSRMGAYSPVFMPSQMVRNNPAPIGNQSYFTKIDMAAVDPITAAPALSEFKKVFAADGTPKAIYRLDLVSVSQRTLQLFFLDYSNGERPDLWGIWCSADNCTPDSMFMLLDMSKNPNRKPK